MSGGNGGFSPKRPSPGVAYIFLGISGKVGIDTHVRERERERVE